MPHPFDVSRSGSGRAFLDSLVDVIDVVEVHNARCLRESINLRALEWARANGKAAGAGSDAHTLAEIGRGCVDMPFFENNRESFLAAISKGEVTGRVRSSPLYRLASSYAKVRKLFPSR